MSECLETGVPGEVVRAGVDGEPVTLEAPLRFSVDPGALCVLVPERPPEDGRTPAVEAGWRAAQTLRRWLDPTPNRPVPWTAWRADELHRELREHEALAQVEAASAR